MDNWNSGYVSEINYTHGYYPELNPGRLKFIMALANISAPNVSNACELGFGQGISCNVHSATSSTLWCGNDFNPSHAAFAQDLASYVGAEALFSDQSFEEFCNRKDIPELDYIALHGIWSWISNENREVIVDFIRRKLKVGGVVYVSYNTLPGWSALSPIRHLMNEHVQSPSNSASSFEGKIDESLEYVHDIIEASTYSKTVVGASDKVKNIQQQSKNYIAHEYLNRDWEPMYFTEIHSYLSKAKLDFACSANYLDSVNVINFSEEQLNVLNAIQDKNFKQLIRDYLINQQFRRDYWVKGPRRLSNLEKTEILQDMSIILTVPEDRVPLKVTGGRGEATLQSTIYKPILKILSDHKTHNINALSKKLISDGVKLQNLIEAITILIGMGVVSVVANINPTKDIVSKTERLNERIMFLSRHSNDVNFLASCVTGGAHPVSRFEQLFLLEIVSGAKDPKDWAAKVAKLLRKQGQGIIVDGKVLNTPEENFSALLKQAEEFSEKKLPIMRALKIV